MARRSVQFWRIGQLNGDELTRPFPARRLAEVFRQAERDGVDRHFTCADGTMLLAHARAIAPHPVLLLDRVRDSNLPSVGDNAGHRKPLPLAPGDHLLETTYFAFLKRNVVAVLTSGNGPRPSRLGEYLDGMLGLELELLPVLREDVEEILSRLQVSRFEFALPAGKLAGSPLEGEWADVLDSASRLMNEGTFRISLSVGRSGSAQEKQRIRDRIQQLIDLFRRSGSVEQFDYVVAEGRDSLTGDREVVDLLKDRFISHVEVPADIVNDPARSTAEAIAILAKQAADNEDFFARTLPEIKGSADNSLVPDLVPGGVAAALARRGTEELRTSGQRAPLQGGRVGAPETVKAETAKAVPAKAGKDGTDSELVRR